MNLFITNLSDKTSADDLREAFEVYGDVSNARLLKEYGTGRPLGFGSVDMHDSLQAGRAARGLHLHVLGGRVVTVRESRSRGASPPTRMYGRIS